MLICKIYGRVKLEFSFIFLFSNTDLPQAFLNAPKKGARHLIYKKKSNFDKHSGEDKKDEFSEEVKKVIEDMEMDDDIPDEQQWQVLEDIWLKAGEMG